MDELEKAFSQPVILHYQEDDILLLPEMVELSLDREATESNIDQTLQPQFGVQGFFNYVTDQVLQRRPAATEAYVVLNYTRSRLDSFLNRVARQYDHPPLAPVPLPEAGTFRPAKAGAMLDVDASRPVVIAAMLSAVDRDVALIVNEEAAPEISMDILKEALQGQLADFSGVAGVFVKDLQTGKELCYNCDVAFSGLSAMKIPVILAVYQKENSQPEPATRELINATFSESDPTVSNRVLSFLGNGVVTAGVGPVKAFVEALKLPNTFFLASYGQEPEEGWPTQSTTANSRTDIFTDPDPAHQTTPLEAGLLMEALYQCSHDGGMLRVLYPKELTSEECQDMLERMGEGGSGPRALLQAGMPEEARVAHLHGWTGSTHAEVATVYSKGGNFVLSVFFYQPAWLVWEEAEPTFEEIGSLVYGYFNPTN